MLSSALCHHIFTRIANKDYQLLDETDCDNLVIPDLETKLIHLSVNGFRASVFILIVLNILAVDFNFYPHFFSKTKIYNISLIDISVGYFILCHSMAFVQVNPRDSDHKTIQK